MMLSMLQILLPVWLVAQLTSAISLHLGSRVAGSRLLTRLGQIAHKRKLAALDCLWPLTLIRPAVSRNDSVTISVLLVSLIVLKSLFCLVLGVVAVFWLPFASLLIPSIVTTHKPGDSQLLAIVRRIALLQVTSHTIAAATGFSVVAVSVWKNVSILEASNELVVVILVGLFESSVFAFAAGRAETTMLLRHGI